MTRNIEWIDNAKAICIFLVVYGHFAALHPTIKTLIYSFHLPAFLFITGYLTSNNLLNAQPKPLLQGQIRYYVFLYGLFTIAASVIWYLLEARRQPIIEITKPLIGGILGLHGPNLELIHNDDPLWYFPFLVTSTLFAYIYVRTPLLLKALILAVVSALYSAHLLHPAFWSIDIAAVGALFILMGTAFRLSEKRHSPVCEIIKNPKYLPFIFAGWCVTALLNGQVNINSRAWGHHGILFICSAILGIATLICLCINLPKQHLTHSLSKHTLIIFSTHIYITKILNKFIAQLPASSRDWAVVGCAIITTGICWILSIIFQPHITRWLKSKNRNGLPPHSTK